MSLSVMLGLAPVVLPTGTRRIHNCSDKAPEWEYTEVIELKQPTKKHHSFHPNFIAKKEERANELFELYRAAFAKHGGKVTIAQLSREINMRRSATAAYVSYHEGRLFKRAGMIKRSHVWEWIDGNE